MSALRLLLAGVLGTLSLVVLGASPASACSCAGAGTAEYVDAADVVVLGTVTDRQGSPLRLVMSSGDPATYTIEVEHVFKGMARPTVHVLSAGSGASCGLEGVDEGGRYVVFADRSGQELWAGLCGGTAVADAGFVAEVEAAAGPPRQPEPEAEPTLGPDGGGLAAPVAVAAALGVALLAGVRWLWLPLRR